MIAISIVFFGALVLLFAGLNKEEGRLKTAAAVVLGIAGLAIFAESKISYLQSLYSIGCLQE